MEIIRHKTQKIIVIAMLAIMIMCIATPVFAAGKLSLRSNMLVTELNEEQEIKNMTNTTGGDVWWFSSEPNTIKIVEGGVRWGGTYVKFKALKEGKAYLIAKDAEKNGKEVARCLIEVKVPDSGKKDDGKQPVEKDWKMPDWNWNIELPKQDFEMPDWNIDTSGIGNAIGQIGEGLISGIGQIGQSGIIESIMKVISDLFNKVLGMFKNINWEIPTINTDTTTGEPDVDDSEKGESEENKQDDEEPEDENTNSSEDVETQGNTTNKKYIEGTYSTTSYDEFKRNRTGWEQEAKYVYNALIAAGTTREGAAGVLGNITQECKWNIHAVNEIGHKGMIQWDPNDRFPDMKKFLGKENATINDISLEEQTRFMIYEMQNSYYNGGNRKVWDTLCETTDVIEATNKVRSAYEVVGAAKNERREFAIDWYNYFNGYTTY